MPLQPDDARLLSEILFPYEHARTREAQTRNSRFVYYTTAEVASSILTKGQIWMRSATVMNDFMEVTHGINCLDAALAGPSGGSLRSALDACQPTVAAQLLTMFQQLLPQIRGDTYVTSVSEHLDIEDSRGRLSMWRAYGGSTGVALILNPGVMFSPSNILAVYSSPVFYGDSWQVAAQLETLATNIRANGGFIASLDPAAVAGMLCQMLRFAALCTKHPGFAEEREWRVIGSPSLERSDRVTQSIEVVRGVPQHVLKVRLEDSPSEGLVGLALPGLINRIIIGPCQFPWVTYRALLDQMALAGIPDAENKLIVSDIPLRHG